VVAVSATVGRALHLVSDADVPLPVIPIVTALEAACRIVTCANTAGVKIKMIGVSKYHPDPIVSVFVDEPTDAVLLAEAIGMDVYRLREEPSAPREGRFGTTVCQLDYVPPLQPEADPGPQPHPAALALPGVRVSIVAYGTAEELTRKRTTVIHKGQRARQEQ
jgi:hypothetical protein